MKRVWVIALLALLAAAVAPAGEQMVSFKSGEEQASGLLVTPDGKGPFPATVVIQEWWGLNGWVKDQDRVGAIGWCMGGRYSLQLATVEPALAAAVAYYGAPPTDTAAIAAIQAPVLGSFGAEDKGPTPDQALAFEQAMRKAGKTIDVKVYPGAGHAFANVNNPWGGYRKEAAEDAWARTIAFLAKHLKK
jgi:dienelactone hydrolase